MVSLPKEVTAFLDRQPFVTISTCHKKDVQPHTSVLLYFLKNGHLYFVTHPDTRKAEDLLSNPKVSGVIWELGELNVQWKGNAEKVEAEDWMFEELIKKAESEPGFWPPIFKYKDENYVAFKITLLQITVMRLDTDAISSHLPPKTVFLDEST